MKRRKRRENFGKGLRMSTTFNEGIRWLELSIGFSIFTWSWDLFFGNESRKTQPLARLNKKLLVGEHIGRCLTERLAPSELYQQCIRIICTHNSRSYRHSISIQHCWIHWQVPQPRHNSCIRLWQSAPDEQCPRQSRPYPPCRTNFYETVAFLPKTQIV